MPPIVAIIAAGAMGSAVAARLTAAGITVLTNLDGRSDTTRRRAHDAGMQDVPFTDLAARSALFLSILPPSDAHALAQTYVDARKTLSPAPDSAIYVDCNAVSPHTAKGIAALFSGSGVPFVDAGIIGGPPRDAYNPTFYAAAEEQDIAALDAFEALGGHGLVVKTLRGNGAGVGDASALKNSYAGIAKGLTGLFTTMILSAHASSPATATALLHELNHSQPALLQRATRSLPDMLPKAYRFVGEMREISAFVHDMGGEGMSNVHEGMASVYERIAKSVRENGEDKQVLEAFVEDAKKVLEDEAARK
ncbi:6-phosphogluconate dehydrogenase C-terminal domain-like protein [Auriscalpium vulgare]|uniref:6-phosphogluconate dehydrogenase C-terminal domain-like protein n=1 Tax=Auriscalpium vulgare TaxID=40419 RepID=A0ACB8RCA7_9AGAM|nr:6-phosphogluconate dehydrogenase C-terminal domain-like protein [Auriscalpium vulgare]